MIYVFFFWKVHFVPCPAPSCYAAYFNGPKYVAFPKTADVNFGQGVSFSVALYVRANAVVANSILAADKLWGASRVAVFCTHVRVGSSHAHVAFPLICLRHP